jgi:hypothetical protein
MAERNSQEQLPSYPATIEAVSGPTYQDSWSVAVNGEAIPQTLTFEEAKIRKPKGSRAKVLLLNTPRHDEWVPVREVGKILSFYACNSEREARLRRDLAKFTASLASEVETLIECSGLLTRPTHEQTNRILAMAEQLARIGRNLDADEILRKVCPENFDSLALSEPGFNINRPYQIGFCSYPNYSADEET